MIDADPATGRPITYQRLETATDALDVLTAIRDAICSSGDPLSIAIAVIEELHQRGLVIVRES